MGDVVKRLPEFRRHHLLVLVLGFWALVALACASSTVSKAQVAEPSRVEPATPSPAAAQPIELRSLELREGAPGMVLDVLASAPPVWTSYRGAEGELVVEFPDTVPHAELQPVESEEGLVASVDIEEQASAGRPLTRLVVHTRRPAEHSLTTDGNMLRLQLVSREAEEEGEEYALTYEPMAAPEGEEEEAYEGEVMAGTPEEPAMAPPPSGLLATALQGVEVLSNGDGTTVKVNGDGEFDFSTFLLHEPARFVIDLRGVVNNSPRSTVFVGSDAVQQVRMAQFKPYPEPVSRVVFDLTGGAAAPEIERTPEGLLVHFGEGAVAVTEPEYEPTEVAAFEEEPVVEEPQVEAVPEAPDEPEVTEEPEVPEEAAEIVVEPEPEAEITFEPMAEEPEMEVEVEEAPEEPTVEAEEAPPAPRPSDRPSFEAAEVEVDTPTTTAFDTQTVGGQAKVYVGEPIDMSLKDADIKDVLRSFAQISDLNIVVQPGVSGSVTVELVNVPWDQALEQILKINGLGMELEGNILRIAPRDVLQREAQQEQELARAKALAVPLRTVMKRVSYSDARSLAALLGAGILSQRGSVQVDGRTNTLIIKELPTHMDTVIAVIENLDTPEPQVMIEARIVETTKRFERTLGISWNFLGVADAAHGNTTGLEFPNNGEVTGGVSLLTGGANGFLDFTLGNVANTFTLDASLQAAENEGLINILSAPKIATLNNEAAEIQSGLQIPIQTVANNTVTVQFVNATLRLQVTPHVTAEGTVVMDIQIQKREPQIAFALPGAQNAPIATKEARTRVIVRDGGTTVIGGIYEVSTDQGVDRVPGLSNIPLLGHLFKNRRRQDQNEELLIFITPRVVHL